jgi:hypothetical protein
MHPMRRIAPARPGEAFREAGNPVEDGVPPDEPSPRFEHLAIVGQRSIFSDRLSVMQPETWWVWPEAASGRR